MNGIPDGAVKTNQYNPESVLLTSVAWQAAKMACGASSKCQLV